ncbi:MAG: O-antigen ligase family protein [Bacteroidia bacterium]
MTEQLSIKWFYAIGIAFLACFLTGIYFENYFIGLAPIAVLFVWLLITQTKIMLFFVVFAVPLSIPVNDIGGGFGMSFPTEPIIILIFLGLILKLSNGANFDKHLILNGLSILICMDLGWTFITSLTSSMPIVSFKFLLSRMWYVVIFYFLFATFFKNTKSIRLFIWLLGISTCILAAYTIFNHAQGGFSRAYAYAAMRPFLPDHGMYAALVAFFIPPFLVFTIWGFYLKQSIFSRIIAFCVTLFLTLAVILSFTRAAWLSLVASALLISALLLGIRFRTIILGIIVVSSIYFYMQSDIQTQLSRNKQGSDDDIEEHLSSVTNVSTDPSNLERLNRWNCAFRMFRERPILGWGAGTYVFQYAPFQVSSELTIISTHAGDLGNVHSEYLRSLCETGLPGALLWLAIVLYTTFLGFRAYRKALDSETRFMALALLSGITTYFVHAFLNNYSEFDKLAVPMWGFMAALVALNIYKIPNTNDTNTNE